MNKAKHICLIEPFFGGSHQQWAEGLMRFSRHKYHLLSLPARHWKWRMYGAAVNLAKEYEQLKQKPDLIVASDMLDLATFLGLIYKQGPRPPIALYFHENQLTYPWSPTDKDVANKRDRHYAWTNYTSALAADRIFFNSPYHQSSFLEALPSFLAAFPDQKGLENVALITNKSSVLPLGMDLQRFDAFRPMEKREGPPILLWNHRWEYDKRPDLFFGCCQRLKDEGHDFRLIVLGQRYSKVPPIFAEANKSFADQILAWGYADSFSAYAQWLFRSDILLVSSEQDFFGGSCVEAMYCDTYPLLPDRLAYPDHLNPQQKKIHLYQTEEEMYQKLVWAINNLDLVRFIQLRDQMLPYDWQQLISQYDQHFEKMGL